MKGLSDGNVLLWTGHGTGAGMESAPQPGKWLFPVLAAPALNKHTQTHICVHPGDKASFLCTRMSPHKASCVLPPREGLEQEWVPKLCSFASQDTFNQKQRSRVGVSGRALVSRQPCRSPSSALLSAPATAKCILECTPKPSHDPKSQNTQQVIQIEGTASRSLPGRKRQQTVSAFKKIFVFKRTLHNQGEWHWNLPGPQLFYQSMTEHGRVNCVPFQHEATVKAEAFSFHFGAVLMPKSASIKLV